MKGHSRGLTKERRKMALRIFAETATYARVYEALGVDAETLKRWRDANPDFQAELDEAERQYDRRIGELARTRLDEHLQSIGTMRVTRRRHTRDNKGEAYVEVDEEPVEANVAMVRTALTKLDRDWTHPRNDVNVNVSTAEKVWDASEKPQDAS